MKVVERNECSRPVLRLWLLLLIFPFFVGTTTASFGQAVRVSITINTVSNHGCFDRVSPGGACTKPDMMVRVAIFQADGTQIPCPDTIPIKNFDNIGPLPSCASKLAVAPFNILISLY